MFNEKYLTELTLHTRDDTFAAYVTRDNFNRAY